MARNYVNKEGKKKEEITTIRIDLYDHPSIKKLGAIFVGDINQKDFKLGDIIELKVVGIARHQWEGQKVM